MGTKLKCVFERKESNTVGTGPGSAVEASNAVLSNSAPSHEDKNKRIGDSVQFILCLKISVASTPLLSSLKFIIIFTAKHSSSRWGTTKGCKGSQATTGR